MAISGQKLLRGNITGKEDQTGFLVNTGQGDQILQMDGGVQGTQTDL